MHRTTRYDEKRHSNETSGTSSDACYSNKGVSLFVFSSYLA